MKGPKIINLPKIIDQRGNLSVVENGKNLPFIIKRSYWIYDVPGGEGRGGHAFKETEELIIALSGGFDVIVNDGNKDKVFHLNRSYYGLYVPKGLWRKMENFSTNSVAFVLSSMHYDENDYIRNYEQFKQMRYEKEHCL